jgi:nicotinamide-nucleotide adenylyltransferase
MRTMMKTMIPGRAKLVGCVGRFRPLHIGSAQLLEKLCESADHVIIGIGSSNKYNVRNPFTVQETREMIDLYLKPRYCNYSFRLIPDYGSERGNEYGELWTQEIVRQFGPLDYFVSGNPYVAELISPAYAVVNPYTMIPPEEQVRSRGSTVRLLMAQGEKWQHLVPTEVAQYIEHHGLETRLREEFGEETIRLTHDTHGLETRAAEYAHALEV